MNRPLLWVAAAFAFGLYAAGAGWLHGAFVPAALIAGGCVLLLAGRGIRHSQAAGLVLLFLSVGVVYWQVRHMQPPLDALCREVIAYPKARYTLEGRVRRADLFLADRAYMRFTMKVERAWRGAAPLAAAGGVVVRWESPPYGVHPGELVRVRGVLTPRMGPVNHDMRGPEDWLRADGAGCEIRVRGPAVNRLAARAWSPVYWASRLRAWEADAFREAVPEAVFPFAVAVWLGARQLIEDAHYEDYVRSGTAHLLAVSGVHMGIVFLSVRFLARQLVRRRRLAVLLTLCAVFTFAFAAGASVPSLRAAVMVTMYLAAELFDREPDAPTALSVSALIFLLWRPDHIFHPGFLLSFSCVASLLLFHGPLQAHLASLPAVLRGNVGASVSVQVLPLPVVAHFFHIVPLAGWAANLVAVPLLMVVLWLCFLTVVVSAVLPAAAPLFGHAMLAPVAAIRWVAGFVAGFPGSHATVVSPSTAGALLYWSAAAALFLLLRAHRPERRRWAAAAMAVCLACAWALWRPWTQPDSIDVIDMKYGESILLRDSAGHAMLIDGGYRGEHVDEGERTVAPWLRTLGVGRLDRVLATHADADHLGGLVHIIETMEVGGAVLGPASGSELEREFLDACARRGVPVRRVARGDTVEFGAARLDVLHPPPDWRSGADNNQSVVLRYASTGLRVLLTGDIEAEAERALVRGDCAAHVLKTPHHGSKTSSTETLLDAVSPGEALIGAQGYGPRSSVDPEVAARYAAHGIRVWRTDYHGGLRLRHTDAGWRVSGAREARGMSLKPVQGPR